MRSSEFLFVSLVASAALLAGCMGSGAENGFGSEQFDVPLESAGYGGTKEPPAGTNGKDPKCFWDDSTQEALRKLGNSPLDQGNGAIMKLPMVQPQCRPIIETAIECGLNQNQKIVDPDTGAVYVGWWGLATSWEKQALDPKQAGFVTGCVVQRLNAYGVTVSILEEGPSAPIAEDLTADVDFPFHESTVFGDLFSSKAPLYTGRAPFDIYVCSETDLAQVCGRNIPKALDSRICDTTARCGLVYIGDCQSACVANGPYWSCNVNGQTYATGVRVQLAYNPHPTSICP